MYSLEEDNFIKNTALENRTSNLQEKINSETLNERLEKIEKEFSTNSINLKQTQEIDSSKKIPIKEIPTAKITKS